MNEKPDTVGNDQVDPNDPHHADVRIEQNPKNREYRREQGVPDQRVDDAAPGETSDAPEEGNRFQRVAGHSTVLRTRCVGSIDCHHGVALWSQRVSAVWPVGALSVGAM